MNNNTPPRIDLLTKRFNAANRAAAYFLSGEILLSVFILYYLDWPYLASNWLITLIVAGLAAHDVFGGYLMLMAQKKKKVADLQDGIRLGRYTKNSLLDLVRDIQARLGLGDNAIGVYITRDKSANASAIRVGFHSLFRSLNAVYINRAMLHILQPNELRAILGHEFAHNGPFQMTISKFRLIHQVTVILLALAVLQAFDITLQFRLLITLLALAPLQWAVHYYENKYSQTIEYLCDFFASRLAGREAAINALLKIGAHAETQLHIQWRLLGKNKTKESLSVNELLRIYETALPFGFVDAKEAEAQINLLKQARIRENQGLSVRGFFAYLKETTRPETIEESVEEMDTIMNHLQKIEKIDWPAAFLSPDGDHLTLSQIGELVRTLEEKPKAILFRLPDELADHGASHPSFRKRVLALWRNQ